MSANNRVNLSPETQEDLLNRYRKLLEGLMKRLNQMGSQLDDICARTQFKPMVDAINYSSA